MGNGPFGFGPPSDPPGGGAGGPGGPGGGFPFSFDPSQASQFFAELSRMLAEPSGPVNWTMARQLATAAAGAEDPMLQVSESRDVVEALRLADLWLEDATALPSGMTSPEAWTRTQWVERTLDGWKLLCNPVAERVSGAIGTSLSEGLSGGLAGLGLGEGLPPELAAALPPGFATDPAALSAALGPMMGMVGSFGGLLFGAQVGQGLGALGASVLTASEIGLPLGPTGRAALLPANIRAFADGLEVALDQVRLYLALRETATLRLYGHVPWLRSRVVAAIEEYARGIRVDPDVIGHAVGRVDPANLDSLQSALGDAQLFGSQSTPEQQQALARLELLLALVEGWVDAVVDTAASGHLPAAAALREAVRRRRATGGPAEQTFATLVGLELRPRRLREAAALWGALGDLRGTAGRDAVWAHPDLLPGEDALADPAHYAAGAVADAHDLDDPIAALERLEQPGPPEGGPAGS